MRFSKLSTLIVALILCGVSFASAAVSVKAPLTNNMVLQREINVPVYGKADAGEEVTVKFNGQTKKTKADDAGNWKVMLAPMKANSTAGEMTIKGSNTITLRNVLVGEVWVCSGQSNMDFDLKGFRHYDRNEEAANMTDVRLIVFNTKGHAGEWRECNPGTAGGFSATGFFFGQHLYKKLKVPIGLMEGALGGTKLETWMSPAAVEECPAITFGKKYGARIVGSNYNQIKGMMPYGIRGAIWYQGEMNGTFQLSSTYPYHFRSMIKHWRKDWGLGPFPVLFVQLPNFMPKQTSPMDKKHRNWGEFRECQTKCLDVENTGMAITIDVGHPTNIHPPKKKEVGERLALNARALVYGEDNLVYSGPLYDSMKVEGGKIRVSFLHTGGGLISDTGEKLEGFGISGADKRFVWADAVIDGKTVVVSSDQIPDPKHVVYAWASNPKISLRNKEGLPASSFNTWEEPPPNGYKPIVKVPRVKKAKASAAKAPASFRTWTASSGKTVEARLVRYGSGIVTLERRTGKQIRIRAASLSSADRSYLKEQR